MRKLLLTTTCLVAVATPLHAETSITTANANPAKTSTVKAGTPDDILITSTGSITAQVPVSVEIDSNHKVSNAGTISIGNLNNSTGILANAGVTSGITNSGTIRIDEPYTPTDTDNDGDLDGPFALGSNRFGIRTLGDFTGNISNSGTITIEGNDSAGILLGGTLTGNLRHDGTTTIRGNGSVGVSFNNVTGDVRMAGTISAVGANAIAVQSTGHVNGAFVLQGSITATGYRQTTVPSDQSKLDADDLLQGGPAVSIEGNVTNGIIVAIAPRDNNPNDADEDDDGIEDSREGNAQIIAYGAAPALSIGSTSNNIAVGAVPNTASGYGLIIDGTVIGDGLFSNINGNAIRIGGLGGNVTIAGGIGIGGTVTARSSNRIATAISLGAGTSTPLIANAGTVTATSAGTTNTAGAIAVEVASGASLPILRNSGTIQASVGSGTAVATAIVDHSGSLTLIENSGGIIARGAPAASTGNVAIDLSANAIGATIRQTVVAANFTAPLIQGDIKFGTGNDLLDIADGRQTGNVTFGSGNNSYQLSGDAVGQGKLSFGGGNDLVALSGTSILNGDIDFGGGGDALTIGGTSSFTGQLLNASGLNIAVSQGTLNVMKSASIASLSVTNGGSIGALLDQTAGESTAINVSGTASFAADSKLVLSVADVANAEGTYSVLTAGTLTGAANLTASSTLLPYLYKGDLSVAGNTINVSISRKSAEELGLNRSESAAYAAIYDAIGSDNLVGNTFLGIEAQDEFLATFRQLLPDHAGGAFEAVTVGDRAVARLLNDRTAPHARQGKLTYWVGQLAFGSSKSIGDTAGFDVNGWGVNAGAEIKTAVGQIGGGLTYVWGDDDDDATNNSLNTQQYGIAAHWRIESAGLQASVRGGWSHVSFDSNRTFSSDASGTLVERLMESDWGGQLTSVNGHASYRFNTANGFYLRPTAEVDYYRLSEDAHDETGGGSALDLSIDKRTSDELAVNALLAMGIQFGPVRKDGGYFVMEAEAGRREIVSGELGNTVARFGTGEEFTLEPEQRTSGWVGRLRAAGGSPGFRIGGEFAAEEREDKLSYSARIGISFGL